MEDQGKAWGLGKRVSLQTFFAARCGNGGPKHRSNSRPSQGNQKVDGS